jgi:hypothetical protein
MVKDTCLQKVFRALNLSFGINLDQLFFERQQQWEQAYQSYLRTTHQSLQKYTIKVTNMQDSFLQLREHKNH